MSWTRTGDDRRLWSSIDTLAFTGTEAGFVVTPVGSRSTVKATVGPRGTGGPSADGVGSGAWACCAGRISTDTTTAITITSAARMPYRFTTSSSLGARPAGTPSHDHRRGARGVAVAGAVRSVRCSRPDLLRRQPVRLRRLRRLERRARMRRAVLGGLRALG